VKQPNKRTALKRAELALDHYRDLAAEAEMARACDEWERWANGEGA